MVINDLSTQCQDAINNDTLLTQHIITKRESDIEIHLEELEERAALVGYHVEEGVKVLAIRCLAVRGAQGEGHEV